MRDFVVEGVPVVVANYVGHFYALYGICPHQNNPLAGAALWDNLLTCPWHNYQYDVRTGENHYPKRVYPADLQNQVKPLATYAVEIRGDEIWVDIQKPGTVCLQV